MNQELDRVIQVLGRYHGHDISVYDENFLSKSIEKRLSATGCTSFVTYAEVLRENGVETGILLGSLEISYSEFFRTPLTFGLLEQQILPGLIADKEQAARAEIRVWSAGCAAGQEPYSIAILLNELTAARQGRVSFRIFATDTSEPELSAARAGVYSPAAVRNVRLGHLNDYFDVRDGVYSVIPALKDRVSFSRYDLLDGDSLSPPASIYGEFDVILCSNLLFYYRPEIRRAILNKLLCCLPDGGVLVTGEAEGAIVAGHRGFRAVVPAAAVYRKVPLRRYNI